MSDRDVAANSVTITLRFRRTKQSANMGWRMDPLVQDNNATRIGENWAEKLQSKLSGLLLTSNCIRNRVYGGCSTLFYSKRAPESVIQEIGDRIIITSLAHQPIIITSLAHQQRLWFVTYDSAWETRPV